MKYTSSKIAGTEMFLRYPLDDIIGKSIKETGYWEKDLTNFIICSETLKHRRGSIIDIGAHVGYFSTIFGYYSNEMVFAFEPVKEYYDILCENTRNQRNVIALNYGIDDYNIGSSIIYKSKNNTGDNSLSLEEIKKYNESYEIENIYTKGVDFISSLTEVSLIKIDTQGSEEKIFNDILIQQPVGEKRIYIVEVYDNEKFRKEIHEQAINVLFETEFDIVFEI